MTPRVYTLHRAIGRPLYFKGFRAQYLVFAAFSLVGDLLLFVILYICGTPAGLCLVVIFGLGSGALGTAAWLSKRFGTHGLMKILAARRLPRCIRCQSRRPFLNLLKK
jgi:uncharacterized protein DUF4133